MGEMNELFARLVKQFDPDVDDEVTALGYLMRDWLSGMVDAGTSVDQAAGMKSFDLWAKFGGKDLFIQIRQAKGD